MKVFITGATGLVGQQLTKRLLQQQYQITILTRSAQRAKQLFADKVSICTNLTDYQNFNTFDAIINLAGEPIFQHYWTNKQKQKLTDSRVQLTQQLVQRINQSQTPPHTFISGSAMGYYGDCGQQKIDENTKNGDQFPARLCLQWEQTACNAQTRVCLLRTGIVLAKQGGALKAMLPLYRAGLAGKLGNGKQYWAWISLEDMVNGILFLLHNPNCQGSFNMVSPYPVTNQEFNRILAQFVKRPAIITVPRCLLTLLLGERAQLLLDSQKAYPMKLLSMGFQFSYPKLKLALPKILAKD
ncbi:TIGR01777 family oxidoreductase [Volucribacter amazonae]|uniref:Epimerase n=1 Tax=Volucribacter amazonae TaxID=256731 RepID=A0A9X4P8I4_9PAST|nr:TIGR01777 family oxidoreductase [Volucribacter amazonae]MDG6894605.1 epimerase [Volucribacter amazonae]